MMAILFDVCNVLPVLDGCAEERHPAEERFAEHKRAIRNATEENGLFDHIARNEGHRVNWSEASIIHIREPPSS